MEYTIKLNEKAKMIISIDGPELYRGQKAENLASLENISELIKEVLKSRHNDITITEYAEKPSPELLAIIKEREGMKILNFPLTSNGITRCSREISENIRTMILSLQKGDLTHTLCLGNMPQSSPTMRIQWNMTAKNV